MNGIMKYKCILSFFILNCITTLSSASLIPASHNYDSELKYTNFQNDDKIYLPKKSGEDEIPKTKACLTPSDPGCSSMWLKEKDDENKKRILERELKKISNYR